MTHIGWSDEFVSPENSATAQHDFQSIPITDEESISFVLDLVN